MSQKVRVQVKVTARILIGCYLKWKKRQTKWSVCKVISLWWKFKTDRWVEGYYFSIGYFSNRSVSICTATIYTIILHIN